MSFFAADGRHPSQSRAKRSCRSVQKQMFALVNLFTYALEAEKAKLFGKASSIFGSSYIVRGRKPGSDMKKKSRANKQHDILVPGSRAGIRDVRPVAGLSSSYFRTNLITYAGRMRQKHYRIGLIWDT
jgi:hypothetical protein